MPSCAGTATNVRSRDAARLRCFTALGLGGITVPGAAANGNPDCNGNHNANLAANPGHPGRIRARAFKRLLGRLIVTLLAACAATCSPAVAANSQASAARQAPAAPRLPFYVATREGRTIYLLGTLHTAVSSDYPVHQPFRAPILAALGASPIVALELSPDDLVGSQDHVKHYGVCSYACLPRLVPRRIWAGVARRLAGNPVALADVRRTRPWLAALLLETYDSLSAGLQTEYGTEAQLQNIHIRGRIIGLETLNDQIHAFTSLTLPEQWEMLESDLAQSPAQNAADVRTLHALWREGDADRLAAWDQARTRRLARSRKLSKAVDDKLVVQRNRRFVTRMLTLAQPGKPLFVAVGALHLGGAEGILARLSRHGYKVGPA